MNDPRPHSPPATIQSLRIGSRSKRRFRSPSASASTLTALVGGFALLIGIGTAMLSLPISTSDSSNAPLLVAFFTATSAACVTGLVVVDTATYWTGFGQLVITGLMYIGGLGIMTAGMILIIAIGRRLTLSDRVALREPVGATSLGSITSIVKQVILLATLIQAVGFFILWAFLFRQMPIDTAAWQALFHSVSGFNNAGFVIVPDSSSISSFRADAWVLSVIGILAFLGAISFVVLMEAIKLRRHRRWSLDTKLVLAGTFGLILLGSLSMFFLERNNPETLGNLSFGDQVLNSAFHGLVARTSGFSTINFGATHFATNFVFILLMFVGGVSGSTAGGIKVNTIMVLIAATVASIRGRVRPEIFRRELPYDQVARAMALVMLALLILFAFLLALTITESHNMEQAKFQFSDILFEAASALGTTGLSTGITSDLSKPGQLLVAVLMYVGRLGPLTIVLGLALRERRAVYRYAQERVRIG